MKNLQDYICEGIDFKERINKEGLKPHANEKSYEIFAKKVTDELNTNKVDKSFNVEDTLEAIKSLHKEFFPLQPADLFVNQKTGCMSFIVWEDLYSTKWKAGVYDYDKEKGWTLYKKFD